MRSRFSRALVVSGVWLASVPSLATAMQDAASTPAPAGRDHGISLGLRAGYGVPLGNEAGDFKLSSSIKGMIPLWLDAGYRINPSFYLGAFFQYGFGLAPDACISTIDCSEHIIRIGVNAHYHLLPDESIDPWLGIGAGYEIFSFSFSGTIPGLQIPISGSGSESGFEFANVQLGGDVRITPNFAMGPFIAFSLAQYSSSSGQGIGGSGGSQTVQDQKLHSWMIFGIRAVFK
jgi:hypothetical protein